GSDVALGRKGVLVGEVDRTALYAPRQAKAERVQQHAIQIGIERGARRRTGMKNVAGPPGPKLVEVFLIAGTQRYRIMPVRRKFVVKSRSQQPSHDGIARVCKGQSDRIKSGRPVIVNDIEANSSAAAQVLFQADAQ